MRENEFGRSAAKELSATKKTMDTALRNRDTVISIMRAQANDFNSILKIKDDRIANAFEMANVNKNWALSNAKLYRKQKRKTALIIIGGAIIEAGTIYLLAK